MTGYGMSLGCKCCGCEIIDIHAINVGFIPRQDLTPQEQINLYSIDPAVLQFLPNFNGVGFGIFRLASGLTWRGKPIIPVANWDAIVSAIVPEAGNDALLLQADIHIRLTEVLDDGHDGEPVVFEYSIFYQQVDGRPLRRTILSSTDGSSQACFGESIDNVILYASNWTVASSGERLWLGEPPVGLFNRPAANIAAGVNPFREYLSNGLELPRANQRRFRIEIENLSPFSIRFTRILVERFRVDSIDFPELSRSVKNISCQTSGHAHLANPKSQPKPIQSSVHEVGVAAPATDYALGDQFSATRYRARQRPPIKTSNGTGIIEDYGIFGPGGWNGVRELEYKIGHSSTLEFLGLTTMQDGRLAYLLQAVVELHHYFPKPLQTATTGQPFIFPPSTCVRVELDRPYLEFPGEGLDDEMQPWRDLYQFSGIIAFEPFAAPATKTFVWQVKVAAAFAATDFSLELTSSDTSATATENTQVVSVALPTLPFLYASSMELTEIFVSRGSNPLGLSPAEIVAFTQTAKSTDASFANLSVTFEVKGGVYV